VAVAYHRLASVALAIAIAITGCATRGPVEEEGTPELLGFLAPGGPTRAEVEARLGPPARTYEDGRIATYALKKERDGRLRTTGLGAADSGFTLVIEYAPDGKLARRGLVRRP
jgi:hypothetical protein